MTPFPETVPAQIGDGSPDHSFYIASSEAIDCPLGEGLAILDTRTNCYFSLNATGALIWNSAKAPATLDRLCDAVAAEFDCNEVDCRADVRALVDALLEAGLMRTVAVNG